MSDPVPVEPRVRPGLAPNVLGALWMLGSALGFTVMTVLIKFLGEDYPAALQTFYRQTAGLLVLAPWIVRDWRGAFRTTRPGIVLFRSAAGTLGIILAEELDEHRHDREAERRAQHPQRAQHIGREPRLRPGLYRDGVAHPWAATMAARISSACSGVIPMALSSGLGAVRSQALRPPMVIPPSTTRCVPVTNSESSEAR